MTIVEQVARARQTGDWNSLIASVPYAKFLGVTLEERDGTLLGRMKFSDQLVGNPHLPALHGGTLGALLELAAQFELMYRAQTLVLPKTVTLTIDYLRSGRAQDTFVRAKTVRQGRRVATVHTWAWQEDEHQPVAQATVKQLIISEAP
ncbi:MAG: PaaI family thioesterase [Archangiaceae bacterium]|nr:PaaI family thioesterase [Archangiaceae bacterium]